MADPLSIIASGVGIADVTIRLIKYLRDVQAAAETVEEDISRLISEVDALQVVHEQVELELEKKVQTPSLTPRENILWFNAGKTLKEGQKLTQKLEACVKEIYGEDPRVAGRRDGLIKQHRKWSRDVTLSDLRNQIHTYHGTLQLWLSIISLYAAQGRQEDITALLAKLQSGVQDISKRIEENEATSPTIDNPLYSLTHREFSRASVSALVDISSAVKSVEQNLRHANTNKHFDIPQLVDRFYTGRESESEQLSRWFFQPLPANERLKQKRFVVYGVGGSGKTQFCCKFAEDYRERFWGVFCIDARSRERLKQTLSQIVARVAGVDENEKAALYWLSNLEERWLLIIDNADDPDIDINEYLPKSNCGSVLITTRNPGNQFYGNVGPGFFEFHGLKDVEATSLLLKAAGQSRPWDVTAMDWATKISGALGYLALAITVAGAAIREGFCQFHDYLDYHEEQRQQRPSRNSSERTVNHHYDFEESRSGTVEATFDLSYKAILSRDSEDSRDALQLLKMFAFLHCENIRFEFLETAVTNAVDESRQQEQDRKRENESTLHGRRQTWSTWSSATILAALRYLYRDRGLPVLPDALRTGRKEGRFDKFRVRAAMRQLTLYSLVVHNHERDSYSMHPLVHKWAREAPGVSSGEQCVWSEAAALLLSCCILLPPLGTTTRDEQMRKELLPHVDHVRDFQIGIEQRLRDKRMARMKPWPVFEGGFNSGKALMYAKFSIVYAQNGRWEDAKKLQMAVKEFTMTVLGLQHPITRRITLALAGTLYQLGQTNDAAALQEQVVNACMDFLGPDHHDTLVAKGSLGESRHLQGRFSDARQLQEEAVAGLLKLHGTQHEDTLNAIDHLACTVTMFYRDEDFRHARTLHLTAVEGMRKLHGADHLRTLTACEHLCASAAHEGNRSHLLEAHEMIGNVLETRKVILGREHGYTLLAMVILALVKKGLGDFTGAEQLMLLGLPIAERNFGADHIAYLWGQYHLGAIWVKQERWEEAKKLLLDVTERQKYLLQGRGRYHPDRIGGLMQLAEVYNALGEDDRRDSFVNEALDALNRISTDEHPLAKKLKLDQQRWAQQREANTREV